jgi:methylated-DNA-protein-cysteine methyltransferase-like protein
MFALLTRQLARACLKLHLHEWFLRNGRHNDFYAQLRRKIMGDSSIYTNIYKIVSHIPRGKVATYSQVATLAGVPGHARRVGYALHSLPEHSKVPWHRVINQKGQISLLPDLSAGSRQRTLLESEGVIFDTFGTIDLHTYQWEI